MAPSKNQYDSIEDESQALIVDKSDNGESSHQSRFRPSVILGFLGVVALYCMVLFANRASEVNGVRGEIALIDAEYIRCSHDSDCASNEFCDRYRCSPKHENGGVCLNGIYCLSGVCGPHYACVAANDPTQCTTKSDQSDYRGTITGTESGKICQSWSSQSPNKQGNTPEAKPGFGLEDKVGLFNNACRNPDGSDRAWCYTMTPGIRWEYCSVPRC